MDIPLRTLRNYVSPQGNVPFDDWLESLKDRKARVLIRNRINRVRQGNMGDADSLGGGVFELRIHYEIGRAHV